MLDRIVRAKQRALGDVLRETCSNRRARRSNTSPDAANLPTPIWRARMSTAWRRIRRLGRRAERRRRGRQRGHDAALLANAARRHLLDAAATRRRAERLYDVRQAGVMVAGLMLAEFQRHARAPAALAAGSTTAARQGAELGDGVGPERRCRVAVVSNSAASGGRRAGAPETADPGSRPLHERAARALRLLLHAADLVLLIGRGERRQRAAQTFCRCRQTRQTTRERTARPRPAAARRAIRPALLAEPRHRPRSTSPAAADAPASQTPRRAAAFADGWRGPRAAPSAPRRLNRPRRAGRPPEPRCARPTSAWAIRCNTSAKGTIASKASTRRRHGLLSLPFLAAEAAGPVQALSHGPAAGQRRWPAGWSPSGDAAMAAGFKNHPVFATHRHEVPMSSPSRLALLETMMLIRVPTRSGSPRDDAGPDARHPHRRRPGSRRRGA